MGVSTYEIVPIMGTWVFEKKMQWEWEINTTCGGEYIWNYGCYEDSDIWALSLGTL